MAPEKFKALRHGCMASGPGVGAHKIKLLFLKHQQCGVGPSEDEKQGYVAGPIDSKKISRLVKSCQI